MRIRGLTFESLRRLMGSLSKCSSRGLSAGKRELMWSATSPYCVVVSGVRCRRCTVGTRPSGSIRKAFPPQEEIFIVGMIVGHDHAFARGRQQLLQARSPDQDILRHLVD